MFIRRTHFNRISFDAKKIIDKNFFKIQITLITYTHNNDK